MSPACIKCSATKPSCGQIYQYDSFTIPTLKNVKVGGCRSSINVVEVDALLYHTKMLHNFLQGISREVIDGDGHVIT